MDRRTALVQIAALALGATALCCGRAGDAHASQPHVRDTHRSAPDVTVSIEHPHGSQFPTFFHSGRAFVGGEIGSPYVIRVTNHSFERIEAVVTVDGRDVVSGRSGNFRKQRGYVIAPHDSVVIDGFRQSLDHVAAFRFADIADSYSSRMGTPQNVGVVGVAVFGERSRREKSAPIARNDGFSQPADANPFPNSDESASKKDRPAASSPGGGRGEQKSAEAEDSSRANHGGDFAPSPAPRQLGTEFGETQHSSVREVTFKRRNTSRPDRLLTLYYDSLEGLEARGVPVHHHDWHDHHAPPPVEPQPFPARAFAEPPPRRF